MLVQASIEEKLRKALSPEWLQVINESHMHSVPPNSETHFNVTVVSSGFADLRPVQRHQKLYQLLADELANGVHALALHPYTPGEWQKVEQVPASPQCMGGSKAEAGA